MSGCMPLDNCSHVKVPEGYLSISVFFTTLKRRGRRFGEEPSNYRAIISVLDPYCEKKIVRPESFEYLLLVAYVT